MAALLIVAHAPLASALASVARHTGLNPDAVIEAFDVPPGLRGLDEISERVRDVLVRMNQPQVLVLTDVFAASPCNAALQCADGVSVRVVSGVNVPMLWKVVDHVHDPLDQLVAAAVAAGQQGVMQLSTPAPQVQPRRAAAHDQNHAQHQQ
ncbi:PTS fructose transporter subunit IIA [Calidifontimicrobium sp. SYSU G02091]|uniref:PTS sugar transporter subunit IIA n=1 Tax=Calidifontimicrobium sp. SYSU G02091 TaxID=2926421 RepID=UPI001F53E2B0|nr:PTS fructose transporter subunit IIA [Calidifontimicrobium sp. SYSU G02091]MCI1190601.1 PTS fructose transporter subunit IIA [Calidifontimicrobium sp. SYSU G02091]